MRARDGFDVACSALAVAVDAVTAAAGFALAVWVRFDSGWIPMFHDGPPPRHLYFYTGLVVVLIQLLIFKALDLYDRPQLGTFSERIPRLVRAMGLSILVITALGFAVQNQVPLSRIAVGLVFAITTVLVLVERGLMFRLEIALARRRGGEHRIAVLGTDEIAARLKSALEQEPRLRTRIVAFLATGASAPHPGVPLELVHGSIDGLGALLARREVDAVVLASPADLTPSRMADLVLDCEQAMVDFKTVPDLYRMLTFTMEMQTFGGIPVLGTRTWPLDRFWNRLIKRAEDVAGALVGLALSAVPIAVAAVVIKRTSPGPVFYRQERCGEKGRRFTIYKLRTMALDAEEESGPVWAAPDDPRRTRVGTILRQYNLDELPQFWNVLRGDMSLVGPRPERPHFVDQFKEGISRYMWRHASKPGLTGWAQVNGLRGQSDLQERVRYDLFYLENWSLAFDFKIIARTFFARKNAY